MERREIRKIELSNLDDKNVVEKMREKENIKTADFRN